MGLRHIIAVLVIVYGTIPQLVKAQGAATLVRQIEKDSFQRITRTGPYESLVTMFLLKQNPFFLAAHRGNITKETSIVPVEYSITGDINITEAGRYSFGVMMLTPSLLLNCTNCSKRERSTRTGYLHCYSKIHVGKTKLFEDRYSTILYRKGHFIMKPKEYNAENDRNSQCRSKTLGIGHISLQPGRHTYQAQMACFGKRNFRYPDEKYWNHTYTDGCGEKLHKAFTDRNPTDEVQIELLMRSPGESEPSRLDLNRLLPRQRL